MLAKINELFIVMTQSLIVFLVNSFLQRDITKPATKIKSLCLEYQIIFIKINTVIIYLVFIGEETKHKTKTTRTDLND